MSTCPQKKDRIRICIELMASGRWITGVTGAKLAKEWSIREETVSRDAAEASRRIRDVIITSSELRERLHLMLDGCISDCEQIKKACGNKSRTSVEAIRAKIDAIRMLAGLEGVEAAKKLDVGGDGLAGLLELANSTDNKPR
jgi:hypothetical protein